MAAETCGHRKALLHFLLLHFKDKLFSFFRIDIFGTFFSFLSFPSFASFSPFRSFCFIDTTVTRVCCHAMIRNPLALNAPGFTIHGHLLRGTCPCPGVAHTVSEGTFPFHRHVSQHGRGLVVSFIASVTCPT